MRRRHHTWEIHRSAWVLTLIVLTSTASARDDCNRNAQPDSDDIATGSSADCNANGIPDECELTPIRLSAFEGDLELPAPPRAYLVLDADDDGLSDLVCVYEDETGSNIGVLRSLGDATFAPMEILTAGNGVVAGTALDWNRDGTVDVAICSTDAVHVFLGEGLGDRLELTRPGGTVLASADLTDDGHSELIVAATTGLTVLEPTDGGVAKRLSTGAGLASPSAVTAADFDGDRRVDIALVAQAERVLRIFHGRGDGSFAHPMALELGTSRPRAVAAGDFDGDADDDLVVGALNSVVFLRNDGQPFGDPVVRSSGGPLTSLVLGDFDGDADLDLLSGTALRDQIDVWQNNGEGPRVDTGSLGIGRDPRQLTTGDFDGDARLDLAATVGSPELARAAVLLSDPGSLPAEVHFRASSIRTTDKPHAITMGDFNGDELLDVATGNGDKGTVVVLFGTAAGEFRVSRIYRPRERVSHFSITSGDFDGDGDVDLAVGDSTSDRVLLRTNPGDGTFFDTASVPLGANPALLATGDMDRDGRLDLVSANAGANTVSLVLNAGGGQFDLPSQVPVGSAPLAVVARDLDSDGDDDLAVANAISRELSIHLNRGDGTFPSGAFLPTVGAARHVVADRFGHKGDVELLVAHDGLVTLFRSQGDGRFAEELTLETRQAPHSLAVADLDGNGTSDLVSANTIHPVYGSLSIFLRHGATEYSRPFRIPVGAEPRFVVAGDVDQDGDVDLVSASRTSQTITLLRNERSTFPDSSNSICTQVEFYRLAARDHDEDGDERRRVRFLVLPATGEVLFQNSTRYSSHAEFLRAVFPDDVADLSDDEVRSQISGGDGARYTAGTLRRLSSERYGFALLSADAASTAAIVGAVYQTMRNAFRLERLGYAPVTERDRTVTRDWSTPGFPIFLEATAAEFRRGDANADGHANVADAVALVTYLFRDGDAPACAKSGDLDNDGRLNAADVIHLLSFLYRDGPAPTAPYRECGVDANEDALACDSFEPCR